MSVFKKKPENAGNESLELSAPWIEYYRKVDALFGNDPQINIEYDNENLEINIRVDDSDKALALSKILPETKTFGSVVLKITIIPADDDGWAAKYILKAFEGNPAFVDSKIVQTDAVSNPMCFVVFKKEVVQYFNDNAGDIHGLTSTLYQNIAEDIIPNDGIYYCTDNGQ